MCKVRDIKETEKRIVAVLTDGQTLMSDWYDDNEVALEDMNAEDVAYRELLREEGVPEESVDHWYVSRKMEDSDTVYISEHAMGRLKERNGWNKSASLRMIKKVYDNGIKSEDVKGKFAAWVRNREANKDEDEYFRLYGNNLYVFRRKTLITVIPAPRKGSFFNQPYRECMAD